jgi:hypothetical protein
VFTKSPRCQLVPLPGKQLAFGINGRERLRWHAGHDAPRPFFFPLLGPSGLPLTRMGHPGAPNHDHHRSIWFAHHKVLGIDFWSDNSEARIRQEQWLAYEDGDDNARMGVRLRWYDGHDPEALIEQELITSIAPASGDGVFVEIQTSLRSIAESLELGQTNFGLLAVRVAKSISAVFGDGVLTGADGRQTEKNLFGKPSPWIDYSGSVDTGIVEGITYFDHPENNSFPSKWHVRDDGWMGASVCRDGPLMLGREEPATWRYLLHAHGGHVDLAFASEIAERFQARKRFVVRKSDKPHHAATIQRS